MDLSVFCKVQISPDLFIGNLNVDLTTKTLARCRKVENKEKHSKPESIVWCVGGTEALFR